MAAQLSKALLDWLKYVVSGQMEPVSSSVRGIAPVPRVSHRRTVASTGISGGPGTIAAFVQVNRRKIPGADLLAPTSRILAGHPMTSLLGLSDGTKAPALLRWTMP